MSESQLEVYPDLQGRKSMYYKEVLPGPFVTIKKEFAL